MNIVPYEDSWTAGQVAEHIFKAGDCSVVYGPAVPTDRQPDEKVAAIKAMFLDFGIKMKTPDSIVPSNDYHPKEAALNRYQKSLHRK